MRNLSKQKEKVGKRNLVGYMPDSKMYKKLMEKSKKLKISLNQVIDLFLKQTITD